MEIDASTRMSLELDKTAENREFNLLNTIDLLINKKKFLKDKIYKNNRF